REARAIAALNHPNICILHDVGTLADGASYLVTELVEGETLRNWLTHQRTLEAKLHVIRQMIEGIRAAHEAGILHRDLKPGNVMVRRDGLIKVLDFGLAKRIHRSSLSDPGENTGVSLSLPGQIMGTVAYMSPEQILGKEA